MSSQTFCVPWDVSWVLRRYEFNETFHNEFSDVLSFTRRFMSFQTFWVSREVSWVLRRYEFHETFHEPATFWKKGTRFHESRTSGWFLFCATGGQSMDYTWQFLSKSVPVWRHFSPATSSTSTSKKSTKMKFSYGKIYYICFRLQAGNIVGKIYVVSHVKLLHHCRYRSFS